MGRFVQLVMGPAGVGKSTYCKTIQDHCAASGRRLHVANLDPAAENFEYECAFDVRDLVNLEDVMEEFGLGPNGGLVYCMEYLTQNCDWLKDCLDSFDEDDYIILDCPGQVELYSHLPIMHNLTRQLTMWGFRCCSVYLLDALFVMEPSKFISGCLLSLSSMVQMELPHINVITKCDCADKEAVEQVLDSEGAWMIQMMEKQQNEMFKRLTSAISGIVDDFMIVSFCMLDRTDEESIERVLNMTDHCIQYGEDAEPKEPGEERDPHEEVG
eukprot:GSChrysophyteH2.ASY1.ANO1.1702.1 assembled CDS